jgi:hypothetical protein
VRTQGSVACAIANNRRERHEVRCCSNRPSAGYTRRPGCRVYAESIITTNRSGIGLNRSCVHNANFQRAAAVCRADGTRLCTLTEMMNQCTVGTGCGHDADLIWTQTRCSPGQNYHYVVIGNPRFANRRAGMAQCVASTTEHEVRCCSDRQLPGYSRGNAATRRMCGDDVWAESNFTRNGFQCLSNQRWAAAEAVCAADGARLCTVREIAKGCTRGTGCGHDSDLVWSDTPCSPAPRTALAVLGSSRSNQRRNGNATCARTNAQHEVRCCSDIAIPGYTNRYRLCGQRVWAESNFTQSGLNCQHNATYDEAAATCAADGARLCTAAEIAADCTRGTGCGHDNDLIWSSSTCTVTSNNSWASGRRRRL